MKKIKSLAETVAESARLLVKGQSLLQSQDEQRRRFEICKKCDKFSGFTCNACGCVAKFKAAVAGAKCPMGNW